MNDTDIREYAERMVKREVNELLSSVVAVLARGAASGELADMVEAARELCAPVLDYEEAARQEGLEVRHDIHGYYYCTREEGEHEDEGQNSVGFDGRDHFAEMDDAWRGACEAHDIDPHEREILEHWAVTDTLARLLEGRGERVDRDFWGLAVWARTSGGQAIADDAVILDIVRDLLFALDDAVRVLGKRDL